VPWSFDLDDIGAHVGQKQSTEGAGHESGQVKNFNIGKGHQACLFLFFYLNRCFDFNRGFHGLSRINCLKFMNENIQCEDGEGSTLVAR
jgi:hypothetical protein